MCACVPVWACACEHKCPQWVELLDLPRTGSIGSYDLPNMAPGVLGKKSMNS